MTHGKVNEMNWPARSLVFIVTAAAMLLLLFVGVRCTSSDSSPESADKPLADTLQSRPADSGVVEEEPLAKKGKDKKAKGRLQRLKKPAEGKSAGPRSVKTVSPKVKKTEPGARLADPQKKPPAPKPVVVKDIIDFRKKPVDFITRFEDRFSIDLSDVDFDADVIVTINGRKISRDEFRMNIISSCGALDVDRFIMALLTEIAIEERTAGGVDSSLYEVSEAMLDEEIRTQIMMFKQQDRTGNFDETTWKEQVDNAFGWERYREMQRSMLAFGKVFLPPIDAPEQTGGESAPKPEEEEKKPLDPSMPIDKNVQGEDVNIHMPLDTWKVLCRNDNEKQVRDSLNQHYEKQQPLGAVMRPHFIRMVKEAVIAVTDIIYYSSGKLPQGVYMRVGNKDVMLDDLYLIVAGKQSNDDKRAVLREMLIFETMDRILAEKGYAATDEEFEKAFREHEKEFEGTIFPIGLIMQMHGYYAKEDYRKMFRRRLGFEKMLAAEGKLTEENLKNFYEHGGRLFYLNGGAKVQMIFLGIYDHATKKMREGGFEGVHALMAQAVKEVEETGDFLAIAKKYWQPKTTYTTCDFDYLPRNELRNTLGEKTKIILSEGYCIADDIFYNAKEGDIIGPVRVTHGEFGNPAFKGEYLIKVVNFRTERGLRPFDDERTKIMVKTDYVDLNFMSWAGRVLAKSDITVARK